MSLPSPPVGIHFQGPHILITVGQTGAHVWQLPDAPDQPPKCIRNISYPETGAQSVATHSAAWGTWDSCFAVGKGDRILIFDTYSGTLARILKLHDAPLAALASFSGEDCGVMLASSSQGSKVIMCDPNNGYAFQETLAYTRYLQRRRLASFTVTEENLVGLYKTGPLVVWQIHMPDYSGPVGLSHGGPSELVLPCDGVALGAPRYGGQFVLVVKSDGQLEAVNYTVSAGIVGCVVRPCSDRVGGDAQKFPISLSWRPPRAVQSR